MATAPQSAPSTPAESTGLRIREIKTRVVTDAEGTRVVPELDADGREIELWAVDVPRHIEGESREAVETHVLEQRSAAGLAVAAPPVTVVETAPNPPAVDEGAES